MASLTSSPSYVPGPTTTTTTTTSTSTTTRPKTTAATPAITTIKTPPLPSSTTTTKTTSYSTAAHSTAAPSSAAAAAAAASSSHATLTPALTAPYAASSRSSSEISLTGAVARSTSTESLSPRRGAAPFKHRPAVSSTSSTKTGRPGIFNLAAFARDNLKNSSGAEQAVRRTPSTSSLSARPLTTTATSPSPPPPPPPPRPARPALVPASSSSSSSTSLSHQHSSSTVTRASTPDTIVDDASPSLELTTTSSGLSTTTAPHPSAAALQKTNPPSQPYNQTDPNTRVPVRIVPRSGHSKMHQTSSRLLRVTEDDRPFTRDFKDLFSTLMVSLPLTPHRVRLTRVDFSFLSEEAIQNLGSLKFSQSNRMPDPKDPSRIVTTTTTTTFSMAREMARSVCQRFLDARFIESGDGKVAKEFIMKGAVWQLTPKGIHVLQRFCARNGINQRHIADLLNSPRNTMHLVILERDVLSDHLSTDVATMEVIFRRMIGANGPNVKSSIATADSDSLSDYRDGLAGVKMASERKVGNPPRIVYQTFTGKAVVDWLMDCCTTIDRREPLMMAKLFVQLELMWCVQPDKNHIMLNADDAKFQPTKYSIYQMTQRGKDVVNLITRKKSTDGESVAPSKTNGVSRDSNTQKLDKILTDPALRLLFRENLRDTHCEENLSFYLEVDEFLTACRAAIKATVSRSNTRSSMQHLDIIRETMASAYGIYNAFLAPGSPCELNIDHLLRNQLAVRMTKAVGHDSSLIDSLREVNKLFEEAQLSVFKLMASDSVPKFMKSAKYEQQLRNYDFDTAITSNGIRSHHGSNGSNTPNGVNGSNSSNPSMERTRSLSTR